MMKNIFEGSFFGGRMLAGYGESPLGRPFRIGQTDQSAQATPAAASGSDLSGITSAIGGFLSQLPADLFGTYNAQFQTCQNQINTGGAVGVAAGTKCMIDLYNKLQALFKNGPPKSALPAPAQTTDYLPYALGGVGALILLFVLLKPKPAAPTPPAAAPASPGKAMGRRRRR